MDRDSSVSIATCYGLDGPRIESRWGRDFPNPSRPAVGGLPSLLYDGYRFFPAGKASGAWRWLPTPSYRRGERTSIAIPLLPLWAFVASSRVSFTFTFTFTYRIGSGWAPGPFWRWEKSNVPAGNRTTVPRLSSPLPCSTLTSYYSFIPSTIVGRVAQLV